MNLQSFQIMYVTMHMFQIYSTRLFTSDILLFLKLPFSRNNDVKYPFNNHSFKNLVEKVRECLGRAFGWQELRNQNVSNYEFHYCSGRIELIEINKMSNIVVVLLILWQFRRGCLHIYVFYILCTDFTLIVSNAITILLKCTSANDKCLIGPFLAGPNAALYSRWP